nr:hypothetical protein [Tanacetum cinerariifolium]
MKAKLALLEASPSSSQNPKTFQPKNKGLVAETFDWDEEEVFDDEEVTHVKVLMALADDELTVRKSHARNGEYVDITIRKVNTLLSMDEDAGWQNYLNEQIPHQKKKVIGGELFTESSSRINENENLFVPASMGYDQEMVPKTKYWVERLNPDSKLLNFNTGRILVPKSQAVNESLESTETLNTPKASKDSEVESLTPLPPLKNLQGASPSSEVMPLTFQPHSSKERLSLGIMKHTKLETHNSLDKSVSGTVTISETNPTTPSVPTEVKNTKQESKINKLTKLVQMLTNEKVNSTQMTQESNLQIQQTELSKIIYCMICKREDHGTSNHEMYTASLKRSKKYKAQPYHYASSSKQIMKAKAKPFPPCTHCGFNDHKPGDCKNYPECGICRSYDHFTLRHNNVIHIRGGMLAESSQSSESSIGVKELWSIVVAYDPFPSTDETEQYPLREFLVKFLVLNGQRPLTLDFNTFCSLTGLDYNGKYVAHTTPEAVLCGNYSPTEQVNFIQQLLVYCLITRTKVDIGEIIYSDIVTKLLNNSRLKYVSYLRFISCALQVLLGFDYTQDENFRFLLGIPSNSNFIKYLSKVTNIELTAHMIDGLEASEALFKMRQKPKSKKPPTETKDELDKESDEEEVFAAEKDMDEDPQVAKEVRTPSPKQDQPEPSHASIEEYYDENVAHRDQTEKLVESTMSIIEKSSTTIKDLYQGINVITQLLKEINHAVKDDHAKNKKIDEAIETFDKISTNTIKAHALKQEEVSTAWTKSSTNMAWNLGSRMTAIEISQTALKHEVSSLRQDTSEIKSMIKEIYQDFKGQSSSSPLSNEDPSKKLVPASTIVRLNPDEEVKVLYMINRKMCYLTNTEMQGYLDKEEKLRKADEEARLLAISKPELIKVVQEEAKKIGLDPKKIASAKAGKKFKKAQDDEHQVLKREHSQKVKRLTKLNKKRAKQYMWTMTNRIKPEPIIDVKIHPNTKPVVFSVYRNNDKRNFNVYNPFKFTNFGITELEELGPIIQKKKNSIVKDLMTSLSKRYERLKKISEELRIQSALPALVGVDSLVSYMVMALMVKTEENARFSLKLRKLIADHPDQEKLKSKRVKLEALGYHMD